MFRIPFSFLHSTHFDNYSRLFSIEVDLNLDDFVSAALNNVPPVNCHDSQLCIFPTNGQVVPPPSPPFWCHSHIGTAPFTVLRPDDRLGWKLWKTQPRPAQKPQTAAVAPSSVRSTVAALAFLGDLSSQVHLPTCPHVIPRVDPLPRGRSETNHIGGW